MRQKFYYCNKYILYSIIGLYVFICILGFAYDHLELMILFVFFAIPIKALQSIPAHFIADSDQVTFITPFKKTSIKYSDIQSIETNVKGTGYDRLYLRNTYESTILIHTKNDTFTFTMCLLQDLSKYVNDPEMLKKINIRLPFNKLKQYINDQIQNMS